MFRRMRWFVMLFALFAVAARALALPGVEHVVIVSFDGGKPAVMQQSKMPTVFSLAKKGACTWQAQTIFPSITLLSHTSMLTGVTPEHHGITWNDWEPARGSVKVPTIFSLAKKKGLSTAMFTGKEKFLHLALPDSLDQITIAKQGARKVAEAAARYIIENRPNLCFVHFTDTDSTGHRYGWGSPEQKQAFAEEDDGVKILRRALDRAGIAGKSVLILTADHGGHEKTHGSRMPEDMTIPWIVSGPSVRPGFRIETPVLTCDTTATALWLLDVPLPDGLDGKPVTSAFR